MREDILKVYKEAKVEDNIVVFRQHNYYVALFDDAIRLSNDLSVPLLSKNIGGIIYYVVIQEDMLVDILIELDRISLNNYKIIETIEFEL